MSDFYIFGIILLFISISMLGILVYIFKQPADKIRNVFLLVIVSAFFYSLSSSVYFLNSDLQVQSIMLAFQLFLFVCIYTLWFVFIVFFTENVKKWFIVPLIVVVSVFLIFLSDPWTNLLTYTSSVGLVDYTSNAFLILDYCVLLVFLPLLLLYRFSKTKGHRYRNIIVLLGSMPIIMLFFELVTYYLLKPYNLNAIILLCFVVCCSHIVFNSNIMDKKQYSRQDFIEHLTVGIGFIDKNFNLIQYTESFEDFVSLNLYKGINIDAVLKNFGTDVLTLIDRYNYERFIDFQHPNSNNWYQMFKNDVYDGEEFKGIIFTIYDITDIKHDEDRIIEVESQFLEQNKLLAEKYDSIVDLLQDVNHRVKINLDLLFALINAAKRYDKDVNLIVDNLIKHISLMSSIYESTYQNNYYSNINLSEFVRNIIYLYDTGDVDISYDLDDDINLSIEILTPLSLILNELLSNAFKHGLSGSRDDKKLSLTLKKSSKNSIYMIIKDNGEGLPDYVDIYDYSSFGFAISYALIQQLDGNLTQIESEGAEFKIELLVD